MKLNFKKTDHLHATKYIKTATEISQVVAEKKSNENFHTRHLWQIPLQNMLPKKRISGVKFTKTVNPIKCFMYVLDTKLFLVFAI